MRRRRGELGLFPLPTTEPTEFKLAMRDYVEKFGGIPVGIGMPEPTVELLRAAVESGKPIEELHMPEDAVAWARSK